MDRKQFLRRSALFTLAAAGLSKRSAAFGTGLESWYVSERAAGTNGLFYVYDIHVRNFELLLSAEDAAVKLPLFVYAYPDMTTNTRSSVNYIFHRIGAPQKEGDRYLLSFEMPETNSGKESPFPGIIHVKFRPDKELLLETTEDNYTTLSFKNDPDEGCFLTTACTEARGLPDDCAELRAMRFLRDEHMMKTAGGTLMVRDYYRLAPMVVKNINAQHNNREIWDLLYTDLVLPAKKLVEENRLSAAAAYYSIYVDWVEELFGGGGRC